MMTIQAEVVAPARRGRPPGPAKYVARLTLLDGSHRWIHLQPGLDARESFRVGAFGDFGVDGDRPVLRDGVLSGWRAEFVGRGRGAQVDGVRTAWRFYPVPRRAFAGFCWGLGLGDEVLTPKLAVALTSHRGALPVASAPAGPARALAPKEIAESILRRPCLHGSWSAKFGGEAELRRRLASEPATTLVTLGQLAATAPALPEALAREWRPVVAEVVRSAGRRHPEPGDAFQDGFVELLRVAPRYEPTSSPDDRFDKWAYTFVRYAIRRSTARALRSRNLEILLGAEKLEVLAEVAR
jgi:hypothetical protein